MVNKHRGEISATLDGRSWTLCLTLGALAELEAGFEVENLTQLTERMASGNLSSRDMLRIIGAGLRGGGHPLPDEEIFEMQADGAALGYARIVAQLLQATFGGGE
ncbi:MAG: gene transfer agent family protein [Rhizobiaceae bacterium]|nr:gene transfer agent family protein [Rhizobiaceae bacterium]